MGGYLIPAVLTVAAIVVALIGTRIGGRTARPRMFRAGALVGAAGFMLLWLLPWWAIAQGAGAWSMPLMVAALVVAVSVLGGGLRMMAKAATGRPESGIDRVVEDLSYLNDLP